jgi:hypothetical protein
VTFALQIPLKKVSLAAVHCCLPMEVEAKLKSMGFYVYIHLSVKTPMPKICLDRPDNFDLDIMVNAIEELGYSVIKVEMADKYSVDVTYSRVERLPYFTLKSTQQILKKPIN